VPTFYAVAAGALIAVALRHVSDQSGAVPPPVPASRSLVLFTVVSVLVTLVAPLLFDGLPVLTPAGPESTLVAGVITKSNIAQIVYLVLGVGVIAYLARSEGTRPEIIGTAVCLATLLSLWAWSHTASGIPFPVGLFDNSPTFVYQGLLPGGKPRVRGIFSEPAGLAASCLVTIAYCASRMQQVQGLRRLGLLTLGGVALFLGSISTSTTFLVAGMVLSVLAVVAGIASFVLRRGSMTTGATVVLCGALIASVWLLPYIANTVGQQVEAKLGTSSYADRSTADSISYGLVIDTLGLGTGLGSNRASSFAASLLSTVGVVGTALFVTVVIVLVRRAWTVPRVRPVIWALAAALIAKVVSGPDLSDSTGILWLSLGVLAHAILTDESETRNRAIIRTRNTAAAEDARASPAND